MTRLLKSNHVTVTFLQGVSPPANPDWSSLYLHDNGWIEFAYDDGYRRRYSPSAVLYLGYTH